MRIFQVKKLWKFGLLSGLLDVHTYIRRGDMFNLMVIVVGNGISNSCSNLGQGS